MGTGRRETDLRRSKHCVSVKVENLAFEITSDMLRDYFEKYGDLGEAYVVINERTNQSRGFGFVQ